MRIGNNPAKITGAPAYTPAQIGLASLTYVPTLEGYWLEAPQVIAAHLASLRAALDRPADLCVFDNGSCPEMIDWLEAQRRGGLIDILCLSRHNLGKNGALNWIFSAMPNEYIAFSDSDVFFRPGWLQSSLDIFAAFPQAGMVSAQPVFFDFLRGQGQTANWIAAASGLEMHSRLPRPELVQEYCDGINASPELRARFSEQPLQVARNTASGREAVTSATDMQFMLSREVARKLMPLPIAGALTAKDAIDIPRGIEALGYWLLSTPEPLVWHMGNRLSARPVPEVDALLAARPELNAQAPPKAAPGAARGAKTGALRGLKSLLRRSPALRRLAERVYGRLFRLLYEE